MQRSARALIFSRPTVIFTLVVAFALVLGSAALSAISTHEVSAADQRATHAQQTLAFVNQLLATMTEAETAQRGYLLTRDEKYLAPYEAALPRYRRELAALRRQFPGGAEAELLEQLSALCDERFAEIARTVRLLREHGIAPALNVVESDEGWRVMNEIRERLQALQRQELAAVATHTAAAARQATLFEALNRAVLGLAIVLAAAGAWIILRRLNHLEGLIKVCAWTQRVQWEGQWITFEEYLGRRFNIYCTHGISDEAAKQLGREIESTPVPPEA
jgi:CHASE3 domain sensor protein